MSTQLELAHELIKNGVYDSYYADLDTTFLMAGDGRAAAISQGDKGFFVSRRHGPTPRVLWGNFQEALEHLSVE